MEEISINTDVTRELSACIDEDLFVVFALLADGNFGQGKICFEEPRPVFEGYSPMTHLPVMI